MKKRGAYILFFLIAVLLVVLLRTFVCSPYSIPSQGMENSLWHGDRILVNKWSYGLRLPQLSIFPYHRWCTRRVHKEEIVVFNNPANTQKKNIASKEVFINRCTGVAGDTIWVDSLYQYFNPGSSNPDQMRLYSYPRTHADKLDSIIHKLQLTPVIKLGEDSLNYFSSFSQYEHYLITQELGNKSWFKLAKPIRQTYPLIVPGKKVKVEVKPWNITLLKNTLILHEQKKAEIRNDSLFVDSQWIKECSFSKDYYWMSSNHSLNPSDSRVFGFVPHDHIIGKAFFVWFSKEPNANPFKGYRWNRFFKQVR